MTDPQFPAPGPASADRHPLPAGGGLRVRRVYRTFLIFALVVVLVVLGLIVSAVVAAMGDEDVLILLAGSVVIAVSSACLIVALLRGRAAVQDDFVATYPAGSSLRVARVGSLVGWIGAPVVVAIGVVQHVQGADTALLAGILLGGAALILAVCNDGAKRVVRLTLG